MLTNNVITWANAIAGKKAIRSKSLITVKQAITHVPIGASIAPSQIYAMAIVDLSNITGQLKEKSLLMDDQVETPESKLIEYFLLSALNKTAYTANESITIYWIIVAIAEPWSLNCGNPNLPKINA